MKTFLFTLAALILSTATVRADAPNPPTAAPADHKAMHGKMKEMHEKMKEENKEMHDKVVAACSADVATTGCKEEAGKGLGKCIHEYKEAHKDFKVSDACKEAMKEGHAMHKEHKEERGEMKGQMKGAAPATPAPAEKK